MANVDEIERRLHLLRQKLNAGAISSDQFEAEVEKLHFTDAIGRAWMIGAQSGKWYYYDGRQWVQSDPPRPAGSTAPSRPAAPPPPPRLPARSAGTDTTRVVARKPQQVARSRSRTPVGLLVGCFVLLLLVAALAVVVIAYWSVLFQSNDQALDGSGYQPVMPMPDLSTATATVPAPVVGDATATPALAGDAGVLLAEARELMQSGRWADVSMRFRRATEINPVLVEAYVGWARALRLGEPPDPREALAKAVIATQLSPSDPEALTELAWDHLALGRQEDAISAAERALAANPGWGGASAVLAEAFLSNGRVQEGTIRAQLAVQTNGTSAAAHLALAHAMILQDQMDPAREHFQAAATLEPGVALYQVELGEQLRRMQRFDEAIKVYQTATALSPSFARAHDGLARAYFSGPGDYDKALASFRKAIKAAPDFAPAQSGIGYVYLAKGQGAEALNAFQKALELAPDLAEARDGLSRAQTMPLEGEPAAEEVEVQAKLQATPKPTKAIKKPPAVKATAAPDAAEPEGGPKPAAAQPAGEPTAAAAAASGGLSGRIVFPVFHDDQKSYDIYMHNADGSGETLFVLGDASQPAASGDGRSIALRRWKRDGRGIVAMGLSGPILGAEYHRLTAQSFVEDSLPAFSPDGNTVVFSSRRESDRQSRIYLTDARGGQEHVLQQNFHPILGTYPSWLKDNRIVYTNCGGGPNCGGLMLMRMDGSDARPLGDNGSDTAAMNSPDGSKVAFMSQRDGSWDIYVMNVDGSGLTRLTSTRGNDGLPAWSPDGRHIAYASDEGGSWGIWVIGADGSDPHQLFGVQGSLDGRVAGEDDNKSKGWIEERLAWIP